MVFAGVSVGGTDKIKLKLANANADMIIANIINTRFIEVNERNIIPNISGTEEKITPYKKELHTLPSNIVFIEMGQVINLSSVFCLVSQGKTTGPIEVVVKKITMPINPDIRKMDEIFLPIVNAKKSIIGNITP